MEGSLQGAMDLCSGYTQCGPSKHTSKVTRHDHVYISANVFLSNTQERKPVTNSRDTQELLPEAGHEMLRIFFTHPAKTSLLQDFAFYEVGKL
jgi:hypothetical protein